MTTPIQTKQDGSPAREWTEVGGKSDTPSVVSWYGQIRQAMTDSPAYMVHDLLLVSEDVRAVTETQAEFDRLAAEWKQENSAPVLT